MSKFDIFNKIKIDLDKYEEIEDNNNDESDNEQSRTEESVATGERGLLWYSLSAAVTALGAGFVLTGKKCRKDEE